MSQTLLLFAPEVEKSASKLGQDIPRSEKSASDLGDEIPTSEKSASILGQGIPTSEKSALKLGHVYAHRAEVCPETGARNSDIGKICPESQARLCTPCINVPQFWGRFLKFWNGIPRIQGISFGSVLLVLLDFVGLEDADIVNRTIVVIHHHLLDAFHDIETFRNFSKNGVLSIQVG